MKMLNLRSPHGDFDLTFAPAGVDGYAELSRSATVRNVDGVTVQLASLPDIIRSKDAAGRPKDALALPELRRLAALAGAAGTSGNLRAAHESPTIGAKAGSAAVSPRYCQQPQHELVGVGTTG